MTHITRAEIAAAQAEIDAEREAARYKPKRGRTAARETIRIMCPRRDPEIVVFTISFDLVQRLLRARERNRKLNLVPHNWAHLRMAFTAMSEERIPAVYMQVAPLSFDPPWPRLRRRRDGKTFRAQARARSLGVKPGLITKALEWMWVGDPNDSSSGILATFPDEDMRPYRLRDLRPVAELLAERPQLIVNPEFDPEEDVIYDGPAE